MWELRKANTGKWTRVTQDSHFQFYGGIARQDTKDTSEFHVFLGKYLLKYSRIKNQESNIDAKERM